jgi:hypothetical protein
MRTEFVAPVIFIVPVPDTLPLESIVKLSVATPFDKVICLKPPSDLIGPLNVEFAIFSSLEN